MDPNNDPIQPGQDQGLPTNGGGDVSDQGGQPITPTQEVPESPQMPAEMPPPSPAVPGDVPTPGEEPSPSGDAPVGGDPTA